MLRAGAPSSPHFGEGVTGEGAVFIQVKEIPMRTVYACVDRRGRLLKIFNSFKAARASWLETYRPPDFFTVAFPNRNHAASLNLREELDYRVVVYGNRIGAIRTMPLHTTKAVL